MTAPSPRAAVEALLPHRDPFLFVDGFERTGDDRLQAHWLVPADADWFRGHYPGDPVLPGVLITEHALQAAALLVALVAGGFEAADGVPVVVRISDARFRSMVRPRELLETEVRLIERTGPAFELRAAVRSGGRRVVDLTCVLAASGALARAAGGEAQS